MSFYYFAKIIANKCFDIIKDDKIPTIIVIINYIVLSGYTNIDII